MAAPAPPRRPGVVAPAPPSRGFADGMRPADPDLLGGRPHAGVEPAGVGEGVAAASQADRLGPVAGHRRDRGAGQLGPGVALGALALAAEDREALLLLAGQRVVVTGQELVEPRLVGD